MVLSRQTQEKERETTVIWNLLVVWTTSMCGSSWIHMNECQEKKTMNDGRSIMTRLLELGSGREESVKCWTGVCVSLISCNTMIRWYWHWRRRQGALVSGVMSHFMKGLGLGSRTASSDSLLRGRWARGKKLNAYTKDFKFKGKSIQFCLGNIS